MTTFAHQRSIASTAWFSMVIVLIVPLDFRLTCASYLAVSLNTQNNGLAATSHQQRRSPTIRAAISSATDSNGSPHPPDSLLVAQLRVPQCREHCLDKVIICFAIY